MVELSPSLRGEVEEKKLSDGRSAVAASGSIVTGWLAGRSDRRLLKAGMSPAASVAPELVPQWKVPLFEVELVVEDDGRVNFVPAIVDIQKVMLGALAAMVTAVRIYTDLESEVRCALLCALCGPCVMPNVRR